MASQLSFFDDPPPPPAEPAKVRDKYYMKYFKPAWLDQGTWPRSDGRRAPRLGAKNAKGIATSGSTGPLLTWEEAYDLVERLEQEQKVNSPAYAEALRELSGWGSGFYVVP
jgi:hypothetical protein